MRTLREALEDLAADVPSYGDLDRALEQAAQERRRRRRRVLVLTGAAAALAAVAGTVAIIRADDEAERRIGSASGPTATSVRPLPQGSLDPGQYRFVLHSSCEERSADCPADIDPPRPLDIEVTVPSGWQHLPGFPGVITPDKERPTHGPDGGALVMGWTDSSAGLYSDPCRSTRVSTPDIAVGPSVDDFVDAVVAHEGLDVTEPSDVEIGGYSGRFFRLQAPSDISECAYWRPWDPGIYAQGPANTWDVWVVDVDGLRVVVLRQFFRGTSTEVRVQLRDMVESLRFEP